MNYGQHPEYDRPAPESLREAMGRDAQDEILREAVARVGEAPESRLDSFQVAMGREAQVRAAQRVLREGVAAI